MRHACIVVFFDDPHNVFLGKGHTRTCATTRFACRFTASTQGAMRDQTVFAYPWYLLGQGRDQFLVAARDTTCRESLHAHVTPPSILFLALFRIPTQSHGRVRVLFHVLTVGGRLTALDTCMLLRHGFFGVVVLLPLGWRDTFNRSRTLVANPLVTVVRSTLTNGTCIVAYTTPYQRYNGSNLVVLTGFLDSHPCWTCRVNGNDFGWDGLHFF